MSLGKTRLKLFVALAAAAALSHALLLRWTVFQGTSADPSTKFARNLFVDLSFVVLAGLLYGCFLSTLITGVRTAKVSPKLLLGGGLAAVIATLIALQARYLAMGALLTYQTFKAVPQTQHESFTTTFIICMLPIEIYGLIEILYVVLPAFGLGFLLAGLGFTILQRTPPSKTA